MVFYKIIRTRRNILNIALVKQHRIIQKNVSEGNIIAKMPIAKKRTRHVYTNVSDGDFPRQAYRDIVKYTEIKKSACPPHRRSSMDHLKTGVS